ncbi:AMP-binding protein [Micromonospora cathayae]|uniref:AMP-binding protein n=1 Tax=Micromonospora cathayae TaxID=3028804 RepID=A0ABY7ZYX7_9ACTN|nr:AMP-binding protein [Micromonospora sp. HUAS 3]WDZ88095.1 AMP-binding protein [Micromonospora sp. HUAS 3]
MAAHGDRLAVSTDDGELTYRELADRVTEVARRLGTGRRLVLLAGSNTVDALVTYLAALHAGHPLLLVPGTSAAVPALVEAYDPDVVVGRTDGRWTLDERRAGSAHTLHPDLALLLSTSGSTGSPKLVRLSHTNLQANAESIAEYLGIRADDRAATTLPLHYCYGLSVVNSHLLRGAGLILTDRSVTDTGFWELFRRRRGTTFAGVPYTFELLDRAGFAGMRLPHLRYVTQAGGRLAPEAVTRFATLGRRQGWDLVVMYGQTEATARMAYLPPELTTVCPEAIGVPVPGGSFRLVPLPDRPEPDIGELVYAGPNVMLGYADGPADLALGRTVAELRTGDVARRRPDGLYELVGRRSGFAKILGLRVDPQRVEALLERHGVRSCCLGADDELVVAAAGCVDPDGVRRLVAGECGLPPRAVRVCPVPELPRLPSGKIDRPAVRELARTATPAGRDDGSSARTVTASGGRDGDVDLCRLYAEVLDRADVAPGHSFVDLGGDSLSYVEMSVRLERALGHLPADWHTRPIRDLAAGARTGRRRRSLETSVALRALAIVLVVGSHITLFNVTGGAHLLLGVAGFNFARFQLTDADRVDRLRQIRAGVTRVALPAMTWIAVAALVTDDYRPTTVLLLHSLVGPDDSTTDWHFWFIEALVYLLLAVAALLASRRMDRLERRFPFGFPVALVAVGLLSRYDVSGLDARYDLPTAVVAGWLFALGWAAARAADVRQRLLVTVAVLVTVPGFFGQPQREALVVAGLVLLVWVPSLPSLGVLNRVAGVLAASSLYIYLTHWQVYPHLRDHELLALVVSLGAGIGYAALAARLGRLPGRVAARLSGRLSDRVAARLPGRVARRARSRV